MRRILTVASRDSSAEIDRSQILRGEIIVVVGGSAAPPGDAM
jgi:hypothetical protein